MSYKMVYKLRHRPTGMYLSKGNYTRLVEKGGKIWNRHPSPKWFPKSMYLRGYIPPEDWEVAEFTLVERVQRPYEPLNMTTAQWKQIEPERIVLSELVFSQDHLSLNSLLHPAPSYSNDTYIHVVEYEEKQWLVDGHHRVARLILSGWSTTLGRVKRIGNP